MHDIEGAIQNQEIQQQRENTGEDASLFFFSKKSGQKWSKTTFSVLKVFLPLIKAPLRGKEGTM